MKKPSETDEEFIDKVKGVGGIILAGSAKTREEFRQLRLAPGPEDGKPVNIDHLVSFLTTMTRLSSAPATPKPFVPYTNIRI